MIFTFAYQVSKEEAVKSLQKGFLFESVDNYAKIDYHRSRRTGFPEVIFGQGKTPSQVFQILQAMVY